ncbi:MAG: caspase family protein [Pseudomonadota bacterium]
MSDDTAGLHDRPVLVVEPGFHTAPIIRADVDAAGRFAVTASHDRTVRVFDATDGRLLRTLRLPTGSGNVGRAFAVATSPDGSLVAVGGWTRGVAGEEQIYLFDRASGALIQRLEGLPNVVHRLVFSRDGRFLAASLFGSNGVRVYNQDQLWVEAFADPDYDDSSYGVAFATDGRLATTSLDGRIRIYGPGPAFRISCQVVAPDGTRPVGLAFRVQGDRLAVGYEDTPAVSLLDTTTLALQRAEDTTGLSSGGCIDVAWSADGKTLFAGGTYSECGTRRVVAWSNVGAGPRRTWKASANTIMSLVPLPRGDLLVAAQDPYLTRFAADGTTRWTQAPPQADLRGQRYDLAVSDDGAVVDFGYDELGTRAPARFDLAALTLTLDPPADNRIAKPQQDGLPVENWVSHSRPTLAGVPLPLQSYETSLSLAIHAAGDRFVLGTHFYVRAFDAAGKSLWPHPAPGTALAVNVTGDGRLVVAAYADGTLRWHAMDDGRELLAFVPLQDRKNWVAWTPEGYYAATPGAHGVLRWHVNRGWDEAADDVPIEAVEGMRRPDLLQRVLQTLDIDKAVSDAEAERRRTATIRATAKRTAKARLHVLAMGISNHGLHHAHRDAEDLARALFDSQGGATGRYAHALPQCLRNNEVTAGAVVTALEGLRREMARGSDDLAVILFSGHGDLVDDSLYLIAHDTVVEPRSRIKTSGVSVALLKDEITEIARHGKVLLLLDACRSGAFADARGYALDADGLRVQLAQTNVTVFTSSSREEESFEHDRWQNGAFTEVFLDALRHADTDRNGLIGVGDLQTYLRNHLPQITEGRQTPGFETRFDEELFAAL